METAWILYLLILKHALADLILQSRLTSGDKLDLKTSKGYIHAFDHAFLTALVFVFYVNPFYALALGVLDYVLHFVIDYCKTKYVRAKGIKSETKRFWVVQGVDQIAHFSCYMLFTLLAFRYML